MAFVVSNGQENSMEFPKCINCGEFVKIDTLYAINGYSNPWKHALSETFSCDESYVNAPGKDSLSGTCFADAGLRISVTEMETA